MKLEKVLETIDNGKTTYENLWKGVKVVTKGKSVAIISYKQWKVTI